jgi:hypothetical protein
MTGDNDVRERLSGVEVPPTGLRVETLVARGRRRVLRRRAVQAGCGVALAAGLLIGAPSLLPRSEGTPLDQAGAAPGSSASAGPRQPVADPGLPTLRCAGTRLPVPAGMTSVQPAGVDPSGRYILGNNTRMSTASTPEGKVSGVGDSQPILWTDGVPQALPKLGDWVSADAVNAAGVVVALAGSRDKSSDSVLRYTDGQPEKLRPTAGKWTYRTVEINAKGDIIANATRQGDTDSRVDAVMLWKAGSPTATKLPLPAGADVRDITDTGRLVGTVSTGPEVEDLHSYTWNQQGKGKKLADPPGEHGSVNQARGDWATGNLWPSGAVARWNLETGGVTELPVDAPANGVNAAGWIASSGTVLRDDANVELGLADGVKGEPLEVADSGLVVGLPFDGSSGVLTWRCDG